MAIDKQKLWRQVKRIGILTIWILMVCGIVVSLAFVNKEETAVTCKSIDVRITPKNELLFINREMVLQIIHPLGIENEIVGKKITALNVPNIEQKLNHNDFIKT